jgi:hypothetical protein
MRMAMIWKIKFPPIYKGGEISATDTNAMSRLRISSLMEAATNYADTVALPEIRALSPLENIWSNAAGFAPHNIFPLCRTSDPRQAVRLTWPDQTEIGHLHLLCGGAIRYSSFFLYLPHSTCAISAHDLNIMTLYWSIHTEPPFNYHGVNYGTR